MARRSNRPIRDELPELLRARGMSQRQLAEAARVDPGHLSRALRKAEFKTFSGEVAARIAGTLGLPADYWPETRDAATIAAIRSDPKLRDRIYDQLRRRRA